MLNSLTGIATGRDEAHLFLLSGNVEWSIAAPENVIRQACAASAASSEEVKLFVYLHHREDQLALYGFLDPRERALFLELLKVSGVGPKQAVRILSGIRADDLLLALDAGDVETLSRIPGIGAKSAGKMILALRGKLKLQDETASGGDKDELVEALVQMGFDRKDSKKIVETLNKDPDIQKIPKAEREQRIFREAIVELST